MVRKAKATQINPKLMPKDLATLETLLALYKLKKKYVDGYSGVADERPPRPYVALTHTSGKELSGLLEFASEESVTIFEERTERVHTDSGTLRLPYFLFDAPTVVEVSKIDAVRFSFPKK